MIIKAMRSNYYKRLFYQHIFVATIYLEISENISPLREVKIFGTFSKKHWQEKKDCVYDPFFKCFKAEVKIKIGDQFKFILDDGKRYVISARYPSFKDPQGNFNNIFDPSKIRSNNKKQ
jgi:hypothetical protein